MVSEWNRARKILQVLRDCRNVEGIKDTILFPFVRDLENKIEIAPSPLDKCFYIELKNRIEKLLEPLDYHP